ncbi:hypothetical protein LYSHEL_26150 [Lysobacter helvus]|uniref:Uncharacterized protein n=2 Tax=Lysobacteraceae TaxID=32033 RepID=A0ABN6FVA3_9GAMM|nr:MULTISPECIES: hypothetical protein [Lysobacter]BCT93590.1 hypothetical protein LYSCAS_26140 [Lysobacter caseinilyticus]BCT96744.1 hypothetical protein LYSHEL_26150 [Lysobacter helvus]
MAVSACDDKTCMTALESVERGFALAVAELDALRLVGLVVVQADGIAFLTPHGMLRLRNLRSVLMTQAR